MNTGKPTHARPQANGSYVTTPRTAAMMTLLGAGLQAGGIMLGRDEVKALAKLYGFKPEKPQERPPKPERQPDPEGTSAWERREADRRHEAAVAAWKAWTDPSEFYQAGADRNMIRHAEHDGLRLIAWLAKYVPEGEDPLKTLIQLAVDAGYDVDPQDVSYAAEELEETG